jgi:hypothetical protein
MRDPQLKLQDCEILQNYLSLTRKQDLVLPLLDLYLASKLVLLDLRAVMGVRGVVLVAWLSQCALQRKPGNDTS